MERVRVESLTKTYKIGVLKNNSLRGALSKIKLNSKSNNPSFNALKDITFSINDKDILGIIGKNGAGKSTLLKVLSRITKPTKGRIEINGRVASLLEVGTGFHPELTGRENIYLNGTILGMSRKEVAQKLEEIIEFSGVEKFIDTPVKHYSSGMHVRLAFSVAAHLEPEILIIDEVLAVGDAEFQKKCLGKMEDVAHSGRTVIFVSHNMAAVKSMCTKCMFLKDGQIGFMGNTDECISKYITENFAKEVPLNKIEKRKGSGEIKFTKGKVFQEKNSEIILSNKPLNITLTLSKNINLNSIRIDIGINNSFGTRIGWISSSLLKGIKLIENQFTFTIENFNLAPGNYDLNLYCANKENTFDWLESVLSFEVLEDDYYNSGNVIPKNQGDVLFNFNIK